MSVNKVILIGNVGKDAECRQVGSQYVIRFCLATTDSYVKDGQRFNTTEWHNCEYWTSSDKVSAYLVTGAMVYVEGSIKTETFVGNDGQKKYSTKIRVKDLRLLGNKLHTQPVNEDSPSKPGEPIEEDMPF